MPLLLTQAAFDRVKDRIAPLTGELDVITVTAPDSYVLKGQPIDAEAVKPEIVWASQESWRSGLLPSLFRPILNGGGATRWMQSFAAGLDTPIFKSILQTGARLTKSNAQAIPIAEYVVSHALSLIAPIEAQARLQAKKEWADTPYREIGATRWVMVGYGSIGHEIARRIKPFGVHLTVVRRNPAPDDLVDAVVGQDALPQLLPDADVVVVACPLNDDTRHLINAHSLALLKPGAILINIGRGGLIDEAALKVGLDRRQPGRAVLDVFETEPLPQDSWLWTHPQVRVSAHTSHSGDGTAARGDTLFVDNLRRYLAGEPLLNEAHPSEAGL